MSSSAFVSSGAAAATLVTNLIVRKRMDIMVSSDTDRDTVMEEAQAHAWVPQWFADLFVKIGNDLDHMESLVQQCAQKQMAVEAHFPEIRRKYSEVLAYQHQLNDLFFQGAMKIEQQRTDLLALRLESKSFAEHVDLALNLIVDSAKEEFEALRGQLELQVQKTSELEKAARNAAALHRAQGRKATRSQQQATRKAGKGEERVQDLETAFKALSDRVTGMEREMAEVNAVWGERFNCFTKEMERRESCLEADEAVGVSEVADLLRQWDRKAQAPPLNGMDRLSASVQESLKPRSEPGSKGKAKEVETEVRPPMPGSGGSAGGRVPPPPPPADKAPPSPLPSSDSSVSSFHEGEEEELTREEERRRSRQVRETRGITLSRDNLIAVLGEERKPKPKRISLKAPSSYSGERNVNFCTWLQEVVRFLRTKEE